MASIISWSLLLSQRVRYMQSHLTVEQWLLQRLFTALAMLRISQSHLETEESLGLIPLATQLQESKLCLDGSSSSGSSCSYLLAINTGDHKGAGEEHKAFSIPRWKAGRLAKTSFPARKDLITFNCKLFSVSISSSLAANEAKDLPQTYGGDILPWPQISLVGVAMLD